MPATTGVDPRRRLPSVDEALQRPEVHALMSSHGRPAVLRALRAALDGLRRRDVDAGEARPLRDLFELVRDRPGTEVRVDGRKVPYAHELWLPLFWIFVSGEA